MGNADTPARGLMPVVSFGAAPDLDQDPTTSQPDAFAVGTGMHLDALPLPDEDDYSPELDQLIAFFADPSASAVALVGPPGTTIGRLVRRAAESAAESCTTFIVGPDPSGAGTAWHPIVSLLQGILGLTEAPSEQALSAALIDIGLSRRQLLGVADVFGLAREQRAGLPGHIRHDEAMSAALAVVRSATELAPRAVLCFEDIWEYDQPSLAVIEALLAGDQARPPMIITSTSDTVVPAPCEIIRVTDVDAPVDVLAARLDDLDETSVLVLQAAAAFGTSVAAEALGFFESVQAPTYDCLEGLAASGFIDFDGTTVAFSSASLRDVVRAATPADLSRALNGEIASALELDAVRVSLCARAHHARAAGSADGFDLCLSAARDALERFDPVGAVRWFACADDLATDDEQRIDAGLGLAGALRRVGEFDMASSTLDGLTKTVANAPQAAIDRERGRICLELADVAAIGHFRSAIAHGLRVFNPTLLCETYLELADALALADDEGRWSELTEAIDVVTFGDGYDTTWKIPALCGVGMRLAEHYLAVDMLDHANETARAALSYAERIGHDYARAKLLLVLAKVLIAQGDASAAEIHRGLAKEIFTRLGVGPESPQT